MALPTHMLLRHHDKDMSAVYDVPVAPLVIPISVLMSVPIHMVIVVVGVHCRASSSVHRVPRVPCTTSAALDSWSAAAMVPSANINSRGFIIPIKHAIRARVTIIRAGCFKSPG